jgi:Protein of unknown function (DUF3540)
MKTQDDLAPLAKEESLMTAISSIRHAACQTVTLQAAALDGGHLDMAGTTGTLIACDGRDARVECGGCIVDARIAFSCIVRPEPGDRVLMSVADGTTWVTAITERLTDTPSCLWTEGDVSIVSVRGDVSLMAGRSVNLDAADRTRIASPEIALHAGVARFVLDELQQIGRKASYYVKQIRSVGDLVETFAEHVITRTSRSSRFVEESDQLRAGDIDHRADDTLQMRAGTMLMSADGVVRVDAEQIHMG